MNCTSCLHFASFFDSNRHFCRTCSMVCLIHLVEKLMYGKHFILCDLDLGLHGLQGHICDPHSLLPSRPHKKSLSHIILSDSFTTLAMSSCFILEAIYTGDVSPKFLYTHYRVENRGKCWLTLHIAIKDMDKRVYQTFVF